MREIAENDLLNNYFSFLFYLMVVPTITMDFQWTAVCWSQRFSPWTGDAHLGTHSSPPRTCLRYGVLFAPGQTAL